MPYTQVGVKFYGDIYWNGIAGDILYQDITGFKSLILSDLDRIYSTFIGK